MDKHFKNIRSLREAGRDGKETTLSWLRLRCRALLCPHLLLFLVFSAAFAGDSFGQWTMGSRSIAMGEAHTALTGDEWAVFHNPAMINSKERAFGVFAIRYFGLSEIQDQAAFITIPAGSLFSSQKFQNAISAGIHTYGFELYRETNLRLGWAVRRQRIQLGAVINYTHLRIEGYGSGGSPLIDAGLAVRATGQITAGVRVTNLMLTQSGNTQSGVYPAEIAGGLSWDTAHRLVLSADLVKDVLFPISLRTGFEAEPMDGFFLRGGWISSPFTWTAGTGLVLSRFRVSMAVQHHHVLGMSPGIDLLVTI